MGCGASKDDIAEPRSMRSHGRDNLQRVDKEAAALKPIDLTSNCICSLYNSTGVLNNPSSPPSAFIHTPGSLSSDEEDDDDEGDENYEDFDPNTFDIPSKLSIAEEADNHVSQTTALAVLSGGKTATDKEAEERVEAILAADDENLIAEQSDICCALGALTSQSAILQALLSTSPVITQQNLCADFTTRVSDVGVISGPEPIRWDSTLRKAEIIDLDAEPGAGESIMVENTPQLQQENHFDQEPADDDHALTEEQPKQDPKSDDGTDTHKTLHSGPEPRKPKLPPLAIVPPILVEIPANPFAKPAFPIIIKQDLMEVKVPPLCETEQIEDLSADRTPTMMALREDSPNGDNHDVRSKSSLVTEQCEEGTPTPATKSPADSEWRSLHHDTPDPDIEDIDLLEPPELDSLPLIPMLDCHGIHKDKKDLISPSLRLVT